MSRSNLELAADMGKRMAQKRKERGMTQEMVADLAGITHQQYNKVENGKSCLGSDSLKRICDALQTSPDYLIYGTRSSDISVEVNELLKNMSDKQIETALRMLRYFAESGE